MTQWRWTEFASFNFNFCLYFPLALDMQLKIGNWHWEWHWDQVAEMGTSTVAFQVKNSFLNFWTDGYSIGRYEIHRLKPILELVVVVEYDKFNSDSGTILLSCLHMTPICCYQLTWPTSFHELTPLLPTHLAYSLFGFLASIRTSQWAPRIENIAFVKKRNQNYVLYACPHTWLHNFILWKANRLMTVGYLRQILAKL